MDLCPNRVSMIWQLGNSRLPFLGPLSSADPSKSIVAAWYYIKQDDPSFPALGVGIATSLTAPHEIVDARDPSGKADVLQSAIEGHVLVKNTNNVLPLHKPKMLSLYGYDATVPKINYPINTQYGTFAYGLQSTNVTFNDLAIVITTGGLPNAPEAGTEGTLWNGLGSGANSPSYISDVSRLTRRLPRETH